MASPAPRVLLFALALAACSSPTPSGGGDAAGSLSADEAARLLELGVPVVVPGEVGAFRLAELTADRNERGGVSSAGYEMTYRREDGACFEVFGTDEGLGGPAFPLASTDVRLDALPGRPTVALYRAPDAPDVPSAQAWGPGTVISDDVPVGGIVARFRSASGDGCRALTLGEAAPIFAGLRVLAGADGPRRDLSAPPRPPAPVDLTNLGTFAPAPTVLGDPAIESGRTPEEAARGLADRYRGEARSVEVQIVQAVGGEATVLVTATGLGDDSIDGERHRLAYEQGEDGTWFIEDAGVQVRCHAGRGHTDWSAEPCL